MVDILTSPLDLFLDVVGWVLWAPAMYAFWLMRQAQRKWRERWRSVSTMLHASDEENEQLRHQRDDYLYLSQSLVETIDQAEARWKRQFDTETFADESTSETPIERVIREEEQRQYKRAKEALARTARVVAEGRKRQREERDRKFEEHRERTLAFARYASGKGYRR